MSMHNEGGHVPTPATPSEAHYVAVQQSPEFQDLRRRFRGWVLPVAAAALLWYFAYVLLAAYAVDFMSQEVIGSINVGLLLGLVQFVTTFAITALYIHHAGKVFDPASSRIREEMEEGGPT